MDRIERLAELRREVAPYPNSAACKVLHHLLTMMIEVLQEEQLTTAEPTPTAHIVVDHSVAEEPINLKTFQSSQSAQVDMPSSPVEPSSECVHPTYQLVVAVRDSKGTLMVQCRQCHVYLWFEPTPAQGVDRTFSTSARGASSRFVENSVEESVQSPSNEYPNEDQLKWLDKGGEIALTTLKEFIEGRLEINRNDFKE